MKVDNYGYYSGNTIKINSKLLDIKQPYELIYTIAHEQQHAFQNYSIENKVETAEQYMWKLNLILNSKGDLINYYDAGKTDNEYNRYYLQPVEYNANAIALESCKNIFGKYESKKFDKWSSLKENELKDRIMDFYFEHSNFQKDMLNHFEDRAKNIGYNIKNLRTLIVDLKDIEWVKQLENPQVIKKLESLKKCSFEDTAPLDVNEVRAKLNESKKPLKKVLINEKTTKKCNKGEKQIIFETSVVNKIDNTKGTVHMYQLNDNPDKCFLGKKENNAIKKLGEIKTLGSVKKEFKEFKQYMVKNSKTIDKDKVKTDDLSL